MSRRSPTLGCLDRGIVHRLIEPGLDGGTHPRDEAFPDVRQRAGAGQSLDRLDSRHPPPGELLDGFRPRTPADLVTPCPPVVGYAYVRVRSLQHQLDRTNVVLPENTEALTGNLQAQVVPVKYGA